MRCVFVFCVFQVMEDGARGDDGFPQAIDAESFHGSRLELAYQFFVCIVEGIDPFIERKGVVFIAENVSKLLTGGFAEDNFRWCESLNKFQNIILVSLSGVKLSCGDIQERYAETFAGGKYRSQKVILLSIKYMIVER